MSEMFQGAVTFCLHKNNPFLSF